MTHRRRLVRLGEGLSIFLIVATLLSAAPLSRVAVGAPEAATYRSGNLRVDLPAGGVAEAAIRVPDAGRVTGVKVGVRLDHRRPGDLELTLVSPAGQEVILSLQNGRGGQNYGGGAAGCGGTLAVFDDGATAPVEGAAAPFLGVFRPEEPLARLVGAEAEGDWTLRVVDDGDGATGTLYCWHLDLARAG